MTRSILITGGSGGIGAACVRKFSKEGWNVAFLYNTAVEEALNLQRETGAVAVKCDIRNSAEIVEAVGTAKTCLGTAGFEGLICSAGVSTVGLLTDLTEEQWDQTVSVNLKGSVFTAKAVLPHMISRQRGQILFLSSIWGQVGASCEVAYSATKAGIIGLTKALAKEVAPSKIRVNCIAPGVIDTYMNRHLTEEDVAQLKDETPLGRIGTPEEVADVAAFLMSDDSGFITGQVLGVNGGFVI